MDFAGALFLHQSDLRSLSECGPSTLAYYFQDTEACERIAFWRDASTADTPTMCENTLRYVQEVMLLFDPDTGLPHDSPIPWEPPASLLNASVYDVCPRTCGALGVGACTSLTAKCEDPTGEELGIQDWANDYGVQMGSCSTMISVFGNVVSVSPSASTVCGPFRGRDVECTGLCEELTANLCEGGTVQSIGEIVNYYTGTSPSDYANFPPAWLGNDSLIAEMCPRTCIDYGGRRPCVRPPSPPPAPPPSPQPPPPSPPLLPALAASSLLDVGGAVGVSLGALALVAAALGAMCVVMGRRQRRRLAELAQQQAADETGLKVPRCKWTLGEGKKYACFLSHFKMEAGSDARFMREVLMKMCREPHPTLNFGAAVEVYLDSQNLTDLRLLMIDGVQHSDVVLVLGTKSVLTRPWCVLEIFEAVQQGTPVELVQVVPAVLDLDAAREYVDNIETELDKVNPGAFEAVIKHVGHRRLKLLKASLRLVIDSWAEAAAHHKVLQWHPHASDARIVADARDVGIGCSKRASSPPSGRSSSASPPTTSSWTCPRKRPRVGKASAKRRSARQPRVRRT